MSTCNIYPHLNMEKMVFNKKFDINVIQSEHMLYNATVITEIAMDLKEKCQSADNHISKLRNLTMRASKSVNSIQQSHKSFLMLAQKLAISVANLNNSLLELDKKFYNIKHENNKLLTVLEKEISQIDVYESMNIDINSNEENMKNISDKLKNLEDRQRLNESHLNSTNSTKSLKSDIDEKYPERWLRNSFMDLDNVINLPSVPEDMLTNIVKPKRTSSLSSLKSHRRVKLFLQRAESISDDDEDSESEEQNLSRNTLSDSDEKESDGRNSCPNKTNSTLDDIKEESEI